MTQTDVLARLQAASDCLQSGSHAEAEQYCLEALGLQPEHPEALNMLGLARRAMGDLDIADKAMVRAINAAPNRPEYYLNLGNLRRSRGNLQQAAQLYAFALDCEPKAYEARLYLGETLIEMGIGDKALDYLAPLSVAKAREPRVWRAYAEALKAAGRTEDALKAYDRAIELDPAYAAAHHNRGALLNDMGRFEEALRSLDKAEGAGLKRAEAHVNRAHALMGIGKMDAAVDEFTFALARDPENSQAHRELADLLWMMGREALLTKTIEAARKSKPDSHVLRLTHGLILRQTGQYAAAEAVLREAFPDSDAWPRVQAALAGLRNDQGDHAGALALSDKARAQLPDDDAAQDAYVVALLALGRYDDALMACEQRLALHPDDQRWIAYKATALRGLGRSEYHELYNYDRYVRAYDLPTPEGWLSQRDFLKDLKSTLEGMHHFRQHPLTQSLRHGSQTTRDLSKVDHPVLRAFFTSIDGLIHSYMADLGRSGGVIERRNTGDYRFNGAWSIRLNPNGFHVDHVHSKGWLSSAFYVDVPEAALDTETREGWIKFGEPGVKVANAMPAEHWVRPRAGRLVLFPSYMWHGTVPFTHGTSRLTLPFDIVPN